MMTENTLTFDINDDSYPLPEDPIEAMREIENSMRNVYPDTSLSG